MDTLHGNLETFGLSDVVRLIAAAGRVGVLKVDTFRLKGRVFMSEGAVTYATTRGEDGNVRDLEHMASPGVRMPARERRGRKQSGFGHAVDELVEQQVVEVFVRLMRLERGAFSFEEGVRTNAYGSGTALAMAVDKLIEQAEERITEWEAIEALVPSASTRFELNPDLGDDEFEVTLDARSWQFLAAVGVSASVGDLAERLRIFEFPAARKVAEFVKRGLLRPVPSHGGGERSTEPGGETRPEEAERPESRVWPERVEHLDPTPPPADEDHSPPY